MPDSRLVLHGNLEISWVLCQADWPLRFAAGNLLNSSVNDSGAQIGNGYAAFFVRGGHEFVAGLFNGALSYKLRTTSHRARQLRHYSDSSLFDVITFPTHRRLPLRRNRVAHSHVLSLRLPSLSRGADLGGQCPDHGR